MLKILHSTFLNTELQRTQRMKPDKAAKLRNNYKLKITNYECNALKINDLLFQNESVI
jgi:hypothetical protein